MDRLYSNSLSPGSSFLLIPSQLSQMNDRLSNEKRVNRRAPSFTKNLKIKNKKIKANSLISHNKEYIKPTQLRRPKKKEK